MKRLLNQALFVLPIAALIAVPIVLYVQNKDSEQTTSNEKIAHHSSAFNPHAKFTHNNSTNNENKYSMMEPFANGGMTGFSYAMKQSMNPNTWMNIMMGMMNPHQTSPIAMCANCHQGEELTRYQQTFGTMMQSMWNPYQSMMNPMMMNPMMMNQMMHQMTAPMMSFGFPAQTPRPNNAMPSPMSPKDYEKWYNEQLKK